MRQLKIVNIKTISNREFEMPDSGLVMVSGANGSGKSTIVQCLEAIYMANNFIKEPITKGKQEGSVTYRGKDKSGQEVTIQMIPGEKGVTEFLAFRTGEKGNLVTIKEPARIRELFGTYFPISVHEALNMMKYAEGKREFFDKYISQTVEQVTMNRIQEIDVQISDKKNVKTEGNVFHSRTAAKKELERLSGLLASLELTADDKEVILKEPRIKEVEANLAIIINEVNAWTEKRDEMERNLRLVKMEKANIVTAINELGDLLGGEISAMGANLIHTMEIEIENRFKPVPNPHQDIHIEGERAKISNWKVRLATAKNKMESIEGVKHEFEEAEKKEQDLSNKLEQLRKERSELLTSGTGLPKGITIDEDYSLRINDILFDPASISETEAKIFMIKLLAAISNADFINIGDWSLFDKNSLSMLQKVADSNNMMLIGQYVKDKELEVQTLIVD